MVASIVAAAGGCERSTPASRSPTERSPALAGDAPWFEEIASRAGVSFVWDSGQRGQYFLPEIMGGGAALFDMDGDGWLDLYLVQAGDMAVPPEQRPPNRLLRNRGDGTFEDVTVQSGADDRGYGMGVACGDYDNDGDVDLYVTNVGRNVLLRNGGAGRFTNVTDEAAVGHAAWGASAAFADIDRDGDLDLFVTNYVNWSVNNNLNCYLNASVLDYCGPNNYQAPAVDVLYRNNGDGTFTDVTEESGIASAFGNGLGVVCADFNLDGHVDIFVTNDGGKDQLWRNRADGTFEEVGMLTGCALDLDGLAKAGMGVVAGDLDGDGDPDLLVCNQRRESDSLFINEDGIHFTDRTAHLGLGMVSTAFTRFGIGWIDFNNDGEIDLYEANGKVTMSGRSYKDYSEEPYAEPNLLFRGLPGGRFTEVHPRGGTASLFVATSRAAAFGDIHNDGGVDMVVVNKDGPAHVLRNVVPTRGNFLSLRVIDEHGRDAYHTTVRIAVEGRTIIRDVRADYSYLSSNDPRVHVGLGRATSINDVAVQWIDGTKESFGPLSVNQFVVLRRGSGRATGQVPESVE